MCQTEKSSSIIQILKINLICLVKVFFKDQMGIQENVMIPEVW